MKGTAPRPGITVGNVRYRLGYEPSPEAPVAWSAGVSWAAHIHRRRRAEWPGYSGGQVAYLSAVQSTCFFTEGCSRRP